MFKIQTFCFNPFSENSYVVSQNGNGFIIDPGCLYKDEYDELDSYLDLNNIKLNSILITHAHLDHLFGCNYIKNKYNSKIYLPEIDKPLYDNIKNQGNQFNIKLEPLPEPDSFISSDDIFQIGELSIRPLFTPGHTPGEYCYLLEQQSVCFTGDVLFANGIGRTDLWKGSYKDLMNSINTKLLSLNESVVIYPGHGETSTIGNEKINNQYLNYI